MGKLHRLAIRLLAISGAIVLTTSTIHAAEPAAVGKSEVGKGDWPQFLGPQRNGISAETNLLDAWPADGLKIVWRVPGGVGLSGLSISQDRLLTLVQRDNQQWLIAVDARKGVEQWQAPIAPQYKNQMGDGPRATPTIADDHVYVVSGEGIVVAASLTDGRILWSRNVLAELGGKPAEYGMACSPLVVGDQVVVTVGAPQATVVGLELSTGKIVWKAGSDTTGYSSPALLNIHGKHQIVAFTGNSALGLAPESGKVLWRYPYETDYQCNIATPLVHENNVFISSGENHGSVMLGLGPSGDGFQVAPVWESQGPKSVMRNEWQTSILIDGHLYGFDNIGSAGPITHLACINASNGERAWQQLRFGKGNAIAADGKLWISTMNGDLVIVRAVPTGFQEIGRQTVLGPMRQAPALSKGLLYLRDNKEIVCIDVRRPNKP